MAGINYCFITKTGTILPLYLQLTQDKVFTTETPFQLGFLEKRPKSSLRADLKLKEYSEVESQELEQK